MEALKYNAKGELVETNVRLTRRANSSYYNMGNGLWLRKILVKIRELQKPAVFSHSDFPSLSINSLYNKILQGWNWLIDNDPESWVKELRKDCYVQRDVECVMITFKSARQNIGEPSFNEETTRSDAVKLEVDIVSFAGSAAPGDVFTRTDLMLNDSMQIKFRDHLATVLGASGDRFKYIVTATSIKIMRI